ncbi:MAG: allantoate deiminase [Alphaproteobacteria bacterium]|nr:allantoate deiminase [Alphaproteobacteria bacterium]
MSAPDPHGLGARAEAMIEELGAISAESGRLVRLFLTPEHRRAADLVAGWMRAAGLSVGEDALGTVRGRFGSAKRRLLIGSHIDTVVDAGKYDGPFGVIAGILAAEHFARAKAELPFGIDVLAFGDEEGSRFPATLTSSSACAGVFEPEALATADAKGVTLAEALQQYGKNLGEIPVAAYATGEAAGYVEVHIEQGPVLEAKGEPLGIVTGIVGQVRLRVTVTGEAGHAGTVPMNLRRDAYAGAAEMALALETVAREHPDDGMVGTVGRIEAAPGAVNIIPGRVWFTVDLRALSDGLRVAATERFTAEAARIGKARGLKVAIEPFHEIATAHCAQAMQDALAASVTELGHQPIRLPSGAGHDAQVMARLCPSAMLFVRCRGGVSHNPAEFASVADMGLAIAALTRFIEKFKAD